MPLFTSKREKRLWLYALLVVVAIFSSLIFGFPLLKLLGNQNLQALIFIAGMIMVGVTVFLHTFRRNSSKGEILTIIGLAVVFLMLFLRLGLAERTHLIEYSVLTVFVHRAFLERYQHLYKQFYVAIMALLVSFIIGGIDEFVQILIPNRVFDPADLFFNGFAACIAIGASLLWQWIRKKTALRS